MRIFRGLENIHAVIDRHEAEWRKSQGEEEPEHSRLPSLEEAVRRRLTARPSEGSGRFAADRFLSGKTEPVNLKKSPEPEDAGKFSANRFFDGEIESADSPDNSTELEDAGRFSASRFFDAETESADSPDNPTELEDAGRFSAGRFLDGEDYTVPEVESVPDSTSLDSEHHSWLYNEVIKAVNKASGGRKDTKIVAVFVPVVQNTGEAREIPADDSEVPYDRENAQAVEIIGNKDSRHSQLHDEVMRAVNDSAGDSRKVVALFVPLLQDGKEFENLPADETVTLPPVSEDAVKIEAATEELPAELEPLPEAGPEIDEAPALSLIAESEALPELEPQEIPEPEDGVTEEILAAATEEAESVPENTEEIPEPETESGLPVEELNFIPEGQAEPDAELAEAFREIEEKLEDASQDEDAQELTENEPEAVVVLEEVPEVTDILPEEPEQEAETLIIPEEVPEAEAEIIATEADNDDFEDEILQDGEPMEFEELDSVGQQPPQESTTQEEFIELPDSLDDDEIVDDGEFDESLTEIHKPDDEEETVIIDEDDGDFPPDDDEDEIELIPDPV